MSNQTDLFEKLQENKQEQKFHCYKLNMFLFDFQTCDYSGENKQLCIYKDKLKENKLFTFENLNKKTINIACTHPLKK
jgi:hypothetical protein